MPQKNTKIKRGVFACSWSGGKDSCFAYYNALMSGVNIKYIFTTISTITGRVHEHCTPGKLILDQIKALDKKISPGNITLINVRERFTRSRIPIEHDRKFIKTINDLKKRGLSGIVFGDLRGGDRLDWIKMICRQTSLSYLFPLFNLPEKKLVLDFINAGFKAVIVSVRPELIDRSWLGKEIDEKFVQYIKMRRKEFPNLSYCGETGEYHTFVIDGPIFKKRIELLKSNIIKDRFGYGMIVRKYRLVSKQ